MITETRSNPALTTPVMTQAATEAGLQSIMQENQVSPLLGGENVKITSGAMTDLEKLVARLKSDSDNTRSDMARMRFAAVMTGLEAANVRLTQAQATALATLTSEEAAKEITEQQLAELYAAYGISSPDSASVVMAMKIQTLEQAVQRAVQEGKDHLETMEKARQQLERDQAELQRLENASVKDEAAIAAARNAVAASQGKYNAAAAVASGDQKKIADAQSALAKAKADAAQITVLQGNLKASNEKIAAALKTLDGQTMREIAAALNSIAEGVEAPDERETAAQRKKEDEKDLEFDLLNAIQASLNKIDQAILQTIAENQQVKA